MDMNAQFPHPCITSITQVIPTLWAPQNFLAMDPGVSYRTLTLTDTWRIIPFSKWLGSPPFISHEVRSFGMGPITRSLGDENDLHGLLITYPSPGSPSSKQRHNGGDHGLFRGTLHGVLLLLDLGWSTSGGRKGQESCFFVFFSPIISLTVSQRNDHEKNHRNLELLMK